MELQDRVNARENSTLVFSTVVASASLVVLAVVLQDFNLNILKTQPWIKDVGLMFSLLGPLYREITIFTIDYLDYKKMPKQNYPFWVTLPRMVIVRFFLFLPTVAWFIIYTGNPSYFWTITKLAFAISCVFSFLELLVRERCRRESDC